MQTGQVIFVFAALLIVWSLGIWIGMSWKERGFRARLDNMLVAERAVANENSDVRVSVMAESQRAFNDMKPEFDKIALFLRENYAKEIERGYHAGRSFSEIVCGYLATERADRAANLAMGGVRTK